MPLHALRVALAVALVAGLGAGPLAAPAAAEETAVPGPSLRLVGEPGTVFTVAGHGRYTGAVEIVPAPDGRLVVVNELSMDRYVDGLAEMPASWPLEALKAQAVAARTYAWYSVELGTYRARGLPFDICATVACQVFKGTSIVESSGGDRWAQAVAETAGETLVWDGRPILARYFSSSGGHTRNNEHVFGTRGGPRPYLKGVPDPDEAISPHHRWRFELRVEELNRLFARGESLAATVPVREVRWIAGDSTRVDQVRVTGWNGHVVEMSASKLRAWMSEVGPRVLPYRFPIKVDGRALPDGLPTSRLAFCFTCKPGLVVIEGKGWGHGVGMSQWGARGKAERGLGHDEILAAYYNGVRPEVSPVLPDVVRVGLTWEAGSAEVTAHGPYRVEVGGRAAQRDAGDTWRVRRGDHKGLTALGPAVSWTDLPPPPAGDEPAADAAAETTPADGRAREVERTARPDRALSTSRGADATAPGPTGVVDDEVGIVDHLLRAMTFVAPRTSRLLRGLVAP